MYKIYKITSNPVVDFAAEELKKYLRMMMPRCGEVTIDYDAKAETGFRLGLMQDFSLDISDAERPDLDDIVYVQTDENGGIIAAICAAPLVLGRRGLLEGKRATCYPGFEKELRGATYTKDTVTVDGRIVTAIGMGAALEFSLTLVEMIKGKEEIEYPALKEGLIEAEFIYENVNKVAS